MCSVYTGMGMTWIRDIFFFFEKTLPLNFRVYLQARLVFDKNFITKILKIDWKSDLIMTVALISFK